MEYLLCCRGSGQVCSATSRVLVHQAIREPLLEQLRVRLSAVRIGDSLDADMMSHQGPTMVGEFALNIYIAVKHIYFEWIQYG